MSSSVSINGSAYSVPQQGDSDWGNSLNAFLRAAAQLFAGILTFGNAATPNSTGTTYLRPVYKSATSDSTQVTMRAPFAGKLKNLYIQAQTGPVGGSITFTLRKNFVDTGITCTLANGFAQTADTTHEVTVVAGDQLSLKAVSNAGVGTGASEVIATIGLSPS